jgi:hypothetical protein
MENICILQSDIESKISYPKSIHDKQLQSIGIGSIFKMNDKLYVLTCYHCIKDTLNHEIIFNKKKYNCSVANVSDELELALLTINDDDNFNKKESFLNLDNLLLDMHVINDEFSIKTVDVNKYVDKKKISKLEMKCVYSDIIHQSLESINMPKIPFLTGRVSYDYSIEGISGSLVTDKDDKIIGMVSNSFSSVIHIIPSGIIYRFLREIKESNDFVGLCTLVGKFTTCYFYDESKNKVNGISIEDTCNINYNDYEYKQDKNEKGTNLKNSDVIIEIDGRKIDENNCVYDDNLKINVSFNTYVALNHICGSLISLKLMRLSKIKGDDYKEKTMMVRARPLHSMKYIQNAFNGKTFAYNGLIFGEISEDIINNYIKVGIYIGKSLQDNYLVNPYRNNDERVVVLLDVNRKQIREELNDIVDRLKLPLVNISDKNYSIPIVSKLNKRRITSLDDMINILKKQFNGIMYLSVYRSNEIKVVIKEGQIFSINNS